MVVWTLLNFGCLQKYISRQKGAKSGAQRERLRLEMLLWASPVGVLKAFGEECALREGK